MYDNDKLLEILNEHGSKITINLTLTELFQFGEKIAESAAKKVLDNHKEKLLTKEEVSEMFSISKTTLWRWQRDDLISFRKIGNRVYFPELEIRKMIQS